MYTILHFLLIITELDPTFVIYATKLESVNMITDENGQIYRYHIEDNTVALYFIRMSPPRGGSGELGYHPLPPPHPPAVLVGGVDESSLR